MLEPLDQGIGGEEGVADEEVEFHELIELDYPAMAGALDVLK